MKTSQSDSDPHSEVKSRPLSVDRHVISLQKKKEKEKKHFWIVPVSADHLKRDFSSGESFSLS